MSASAILATYEKFALTPKHFLMTFLLQHKDPVTLKKIWKVYTSTPDLRQSGIFKSVSHMRKAAVGPLLEAGIIVRDRAADLPKFKHSGKKQAE